MWSKYITRRLAVQVAQAWNFGFGTAMQKIYGVSIKNTLIFRDKQKTEYYVDSAQYDTYIKGLYTLLRNEKFLKEFHKNAKKKLEDILHQTQTRLAKNFSKLSNQELLQLYCKLILPNSEQFYIRMWTVFNINEPLANILKRELEKKYKNPALVDRYLLQLSSPLKPNDILNERVDLLNIIIKKPNIHHIKFELLLKKHTKKYQHIPMFDFDHEPYTYKHFLKETARIKNPKKELEKIKKTFIQRKEEVKQILNNIKSNKKLLNLTKFLQENVILRDYRDMIRQKYNIELRKFYIEIGKRLNLAISEIAVLTNDEIIKHLSKEIKFSRTEIQKRARAYLLIQKGSKVKLYSGNKAIQKAKHIIHDDKKNTTKNKLRGIVGSKGKALGRAVIVFTNRDLHKVKKDDIMVTSMTRQDFITAIRKAAGLVTDEGSIICHAAIIARELNIPCIVHTKNGTKILKDGDMVEVDANTGIIKKL